MPYPNYFSNALHITAALSVVIVGRYSFGQPKLSFTSSVNSATLTAVCGLANGITPIEIDFNSHFLFIKWMVKLA